MPNNHVSISPSQIPRVAELSQLVDQSRVHLQGGDGGVVIDMALLRQVTVDTTAGVANFGGRATAADVVAATEPHSLLPATGTFGQVGLALGGGYGPRWIPPMTPPHRQWAQSVYTELGVDALEGGYPNMIGPEQDEQAQRAYGPNAARLRQVKQDYDPMTMFSATTLPARGPRIGRPGL